MNITTRIIHGYMGVLKRLSGYLGVVVGVVGVSGLVVVPLWLLAEYSPRIYTAIATAALLLLVGGGW